MGVKCVEPSQYCSGRHVLKPFLDESVSTAQQILVRGPLRMVTKASIAQQSKCTLVINECLTKHLFILFLIL